MKYRSEIDGLRGLSVLSVVLYHAKLNIFGYHLFKGGFLGVDIFFVITGFLITTLLLEEHQKTKTINILNFYERRIRRLVPNLLVIILVASVFSAYFLDPAKLIEYSESVFFSLFFLANVYFHYFGDFYGHHVNLLKPLLHLWSLGIEEQYYIFFPIVLLAIFRYFKNHLLKFLLTGFLLSLIFAFLASQGHSQFNFYMLPGRVWEILTGSICAYFIFKKKQNKIKSTLLGHNYLKISFLLIILSFIFFEVDSNIYNHPSLITLIPVISAVLIIFISEKKENNFVINFLNSKPLVYLGLISYSLYLWHFVIFSTIRNSEYNLLFEENLIFKILIIILSIILANFTYVNIEKTYRDKNKVNKKKLYKFIFALLFLIIAININYKFNKIFEKKYEIDGVYLTQWKDTVAVRKYVSDNKKNEFEENGKQNVLIVGNCHAEDTFLAFHTNKDKFNNYNFILLPGRIDVSDFYKSKKYDNNSLYKSADIIILSTEWNNPRGKDQGKENDIAILEDLIIKLQKDKKKIYIFNDTPKLTQNEVKYKFSSLSVSNYKNKLIKKQSADLTNDEIKILEKKYFDDYNKNFKVNMVNKYLKSMSIKHKVNYINISNFFCDKENKRCRFRLESKDEIYRNYGRLSVGGSKFIGKIIFKNKLFD